MQNILTRFDSVPDQVGHDEKPRTLPRQQREELEKDLNRRCYISRKMSNFAG